MEAEDLPQYGGYDYLVDKGVRMVDQISSDDLRWIFRDLQNTDLGKSELVSPENSGRQAQWARRQRYAGSSISTRRLV